MNTEQFAEVRDALERNLTSGTELGASITIDIDGETVVDVWGGYRDEARTRPWEADTITNVWSITKQVVAVAVLILVDRGQLDLDAPVAVYWPEFGANGKDGVKVRHLLAHASGVSGLDAPSRVEDLYDAPAAAARMAAQAPWWEPGTASGYHLFSQGHLLGALVHRVTGRTLRQFVAEELTGPLGADFQLGVADRDLHRVADVVPPPPAPFDPSALDEDSPAYRTFTGPVVAPGDANTAGWRAAEIGAANGHGNARSVARILSVLALGGTVDGVRLLGERTAELILAEQTAGDDLVNGLYLRWGLGFALSDLRTLPWVPAGRIGYWGGWGGSMAIVDLDRRMTISYVMNRMGGGILGSDRAREYVAATYRAVGR
ncbi:serine hydrolase domain-containing protein [Micromonospora sp. NPDC004704]